jgi:hypothetical protein
MSYRATYAQLERISARRTSITASSKTARRHRIRATAYATHARLIPYRIHRIHAGGARRVGAAGALPHTLRMRVSYATAYTAYTQAAQDALAQQARATAYATHARLIR